MLRPALLRCAGAGRDALQRKQCVRAPCRACSVCVRLCARVCVCARLCVRAYVGVEVITCAMRA